MAQIPLLCIGLGMHLLVMAGRRLCHARPSYGSLVSPDVAHKFSIRLP